ncbi:arginine kinase [Eurytemora carolleeae]|uniref:arginine kinase n=1 Tax=Eurytemora carolleeae TaxID=1294199 RepID=UPI000C76F7F1|nr:arginine kinase [Eurytemora carolleeae]|eukprot:XP_023344471.1 arginine kinase-like [Eurytemora affinis]
MKNAPVSIPGRAPDENVQLVDSEGERSFKIGNYAGRYVVLVFYSGDWECRDNIQAFQNILDKYKASGCEVFACSSDSTKVHQSWIRTPSSDGGFGGSIRIPLISDPAGTMSTKYDVYDQEEGVCRNAVVIIDDGGIVRHAVTTSMDHNETARNCLDIIALLKQHKLSDEEVRNINAKAKSTKTGSKGREKSSVRMDRKELEKAWDVSDDPDLVKVLNIAKMLGKAPPPPVLAPRKEPGFDIDQEQLRRMINPRCSGIKSCRATLQRNLAGYTAPNLSKNQKLQIENLVKKMTGVAFMPEDLTGVYYGLYNMNQREQIKLFQENYFASSGDIRLREPGAVKWSESSGVFVNNYKNFQIWVNWRDQLRVSSFQDGGDLRSVLLRLKRAVESMEEALKSLTKRGFLTKDGGFVHSEPGIHSSGFDLSFYVDYPGFAKEGDKALKMLCLKYGLLVKKYGLRDGGYEIGVTQRPEDSLWNIIRRGLAGLDALAQEEENLKKKFNMTIEKK